MTLAAKITMEHRHGARVAPLSRPNSAALVGAARSPASLSIRCGLLGVLPFLPGHTQDLD